MPFRCVPRLFNHCCQCYDTIRYEMLFYRALESRHKSALSTARHWSICGACIVINCYTIHKKLRVSLSLCVVAQLFRCKYHDMSAVNVTHTVVSILLMFTDQFSGSDNALGRVCMRARLPMNSNFRTKRPFKIDISAYFCVSRR